MQQKISEERKEVSSGTPDDSLVKEQKKRPLCVRMLGVEENNVLHGFKVKTGRIRLVDADAGADIGSLCADVPAGSG